MRKEPGSVYDKSIFGKFQPYRFSSLQSYILHTYFTFDVFPHCEIWFVKTAKPSTTLGEPSLKITWSIELVYSLVSERSNPKGTEVNLILATTIGGGKKDNSTNFGGYRKNTTANGKPTGFPKVFSYTEEVPNFSFHLRHSRPYAVPFPHVPHVVLLLLQTRW